MLTKTNYLLCFKVKHKITPTPRGRCNIFVAAIIFLAYFIS